MTLITIRYVSIFDGKDVLRPATVVFSASPGEIISAEVDGDANPEEHEPADFDTVIEGTGCTLLPALIDSFINTSAAETDLQIFASFGISTVLDMCSTTPEIEAMRAASKSEIGLPSYLASGTVAAARTDMPNHLYNLRETGFVHLPSDAEPFVISRVTGPNRADFIKVLVDLPGFDEPILAALVGAAHRHGKLAIAHATQTGAFTRALAAGFDVITPVPLNGIIDDEVVNGMATRGVACVPTLCMRQSKAPMLRQGVHGGGPFAILSGNLDDPGIYDFEYALVNVKKLHDAGVRICAGTEANQTSYSPVSIGGSLHNELELLVRAGLSNREALRAATVVPAEVFGLQDRGALQPGMRADMILLEGNPLADINAIRRIRKVWIQGIEVGASMIVSKTSENSEGPGRPARPSLTLPYLSSIHSTTPDTPKKHAKAASKVVFNRLQSGRATTWPSQTEVHLRSIFDLLRRSPADESVEILDKIRLAPSVDDFVETFVATSLLLPHVPQRASSIEPLSISDNLVARFADGPLPVAHWTALSVDNRYLTHLLSLFFSWDNTLSRIIHRTMFLRDIKSQETSGLMFCSKFLIHSILAISHLYISQGASQRQLSDFRSRGRSFADEALRMLEQERFNTSIPLVQGLALLWIYEANFGDEGRGAVLLSDFYRVHEAIGASNVESPENLDMFDFGSRMEWQAISFVSWGFFCLEARISLIFSREMRIKRPRISKSFINAYSSMFADPEAPECSWFPYPGPYQCQPSYFRNLITYECQLAELVSEASWFFGMSKVNTPLPDYNAAKAIYDKLLAWNMGATQRFLLNSHMLPSVLFLDATFEMTLLELLSCLSHFPSHHINGQTPGSTRASYGASVIFNLWVYRAAYGLRHEYWLKQACFSAALAVLLTLGDNLSLSKPIVMASQLLYAIGEYLPVANKCLLAIKELAQTQGIDLPMPCRIIFSGLAVRMGKIVVRNVALVDLGQSQNDLGPSADVAFSSRIEGIWGLTAEET
ncbi:hypothetical protein BGZ63DRAFT_488630 [Mariannaea sp. PMI_226]|nr:hypothetical protein BGZ63DRAFT_488630 [Mariannaea sp. PMI_226]